MFRAAALVLLVALLAGCGSDDEVAAPTVPAATTEETSAATTAPPPATTEAEQPEALPGLPADLAGYETWTKLNDAPIPPRDSDPHDGTKNVYASVEPGADGTYPDGAIVVKEAIRPGADFIGLIAMMRKEAGAQPDHNDWVWVEWTRDSADGEFGEIASGAVCYSCHMGARDTDYVFTR